MGSKLTNIISILERCLFELGQEFPKVTLVGRHYRTNEVIMVNGRKYRILGIKNTYASGMSRVDQELTLIPIDPE